MPNDWMQDWLGATPSAAYGGWLGSLQGTPALKRYYESMLNPMYGRYMGALGGQAMAGQVPTQTFPDWLQQYPAQQQYQNLPGWMRGYNPQQFSPRYRWLNY